MTQNNETLLDRLRFHQLEFLSSTPFALPGSYLAVLSKIYVPHPTANVSKRDARLTRRAFQRLTSPHSLHGCTIHIALSSRQFACHRQCSKSRQQRHSRPVTCSSSLVFTQSRTVWQTGAAYYPTEGLFCWPACCNHYQSQRSTLHCPSSRAHLPACPGKTANSRNSKRHYTVREGERVREGGASRTISLTTSLSPKAFVR